MLFAAAGERIVQTEPEQGKLMCLEPNLPVFVLSFIRRQFGDVVLLQNFCVELYSSKECRDKSGHFDDKDDECGRLGKHTDDRKLSKSLEVLALVKVENNDDPGAVRIGDYLR